MLTNERREVAVMIATTEEALIEQVADRLARRYPAVALETVNAVVHRSHARFDGRPVRDFVPLLVERSAAAALAKVAV